jgi:hypothetical protein
MSGKGSHIPEVSDAIAAWNRILARDGAVHRWVDYPADGDAWVATGPLRQREITMWLHEERVMILLQTRSGVDRTAPLTPADVKRARVFPKPPPSQLQALTAKTVRRVKGWARHAAPELPAMADVDRAFEGDDPHPTDLLRWALMVGPVRLERTTPSV